MRRYRALAIVVSLSVVVAGCDPSQEYKFYTQGIGTELPSQTILADTALQDAYLEALCDQAGLPSCLPAIGSRNWAPIVQAGMNDIDQRCDAFLGWLDEKRRNQEPILNELHAVSAASQAIMNVAGAGANPITIVGLAFGLASDSFTNLRSSLLFEVDKSTVETIVVNAQNRYRADLWNQPAIDNRASAVYALRSYLRICTPYTIANQINTTVTLVERGAGANVINVPMVDAQIVRSTTIRSATAPITVIPTPPHQTYEGSLAPAHIKDIQTTLCVAADGNLGPPGSQTRKAIGDFLVADGQKRQESIDSQTDDLLSQASLTLLKGQNCKAAGFANAAAVGKALAKPQ